MKCAGTGASGRRAGAAVPGAAARLGGSAPRVRAFIFKFQSIPKEVFQLEVFQLDQCDHQWGAVHHSQAVVVNIKTMMV